MTSAEGETPPGRGRRRAVAAAALLVAVATIVVAILATGRGRPTTGRSHRTAAVTTTVRRRNLVTSQDETGKISYANSSTVANRLRGTLTWAPSVGRVIEPGQRLFDVDNFPVILMDGITPAYRTLESSDSAGPDIEQLNANLIDLGFDPDGIVDDDEWQAATNAGVDAFQEANGEAETGRLTLGSVVFLRGAQRVASLASGSTPAADETVDDHPEFVDDRAPTTGSPAAPRTGASTIPTTPTTGASTTPAAVTTGTTPMTSTSPARSPAEATRTSAGAGLPQLESALARLEAEVGRLQQQNEQLTRELAAAGAHTPAQHPSHSRDAGPMPGGDSPVMTTTSTKLVVTADVSAGEQSLTHVGARVPVVMPSGARVEGRVVRIGQATSQGGSSQVPITIHLDRPENGRNLDQATVSVKFVEKVARHVMSVPVTALIARPGGRYAVQEATSPHRLIDVRLGTFATGDVQVSGRGLRVGLKITESQG